MVESTEHCDPNPNGNHGCAQRERKHPLEYAIFAFLVLTFVATSFAACYTRNQWITADDTEKRQIRAYVGVVAQKFEGGNPFIPPAIPEVHFNLRNFGTTPAFEVLHRSGTAICDYPLPAQMDFAPDTDTKTRPEPITIFPGTIDNIGIYIPGKRALTSEELNSISTGENKRICFWGTVSYKDTFGYSWYTNFCYSYFGTTLKVTHEACEGHNDAT
jgi:hypothetical protein